MGPPRGLRHRAYAVCVSGHGSRLPPGVARSRLPGPGVRRLVACQHVALTKSGPVFLLPLERPAPLPSRH